jgi:hypothetical protein
MPAWVEETGSEDDRDIHSDDFSNKTFAFNEMMQGIYNSFHSSASDATYVNMKLNVKR